MVLKPTELLVQGGARYVGICKQVPGEGSPGVFDRERDPPQFRKGVMENLNGAVSRYSVRFSVADNPSASALA